MRFDVSPVAFTSLHGLVQESIDLATSIGQMVEFAYEDLTVRVDRTSVAREIRDDCELALNGVIDTQVVGPVPFLEALRRHC
jgi:hypothetical protein